MLLTMACLMLLLMLPLMLVLILVPCSYKGAGPLGTPFLGLGAPTYTTHTLCLSFSQTPLIPFLLPPPSPSPAPSSPGR